MAIQGTRVNIFMLWINLGVSDDKEYACNEEDLGSILGQEDALEEEMATPSWGVFLPGEFHGQRSLVGYSPWDRKEADITEQLSPSFSFSLVHLNVLFHSFKKCVIVYTCNWQIGWLKNSFRRLVNVEVTSGWWVLSCP